MHFEGAMAEFTFGMVLFAIIAKAFGPLLSETAHMGVGATQIQGYTYQSSFAIVASTITLVLSQIYLASNLIFCSKFFFLLTCVCFCRSFVNTHSTMFQKKK